MGSLRGHTYSAWWEQGLGFDLLDGCKALFVPGGVPLAVITPYGP